MELHKHDMCALFRQLGLPCQSEDIDEFINRHRLVDDDVRLPEAPFWSDSQASFLQEALSCDSDWVELVDQLDVRLRY